MTTTEHVTTDGEVLALQFEPMESASIDQIGAALARAQGKIKPAECDSQNPYFGSSYADLDSIWVACREALSENEIAVHQGPVFRHGSWLLRTKLIHSSGQWIASDYPLKPMRQVKDEGWVPSNDPQSVGSAVTYARRYALQAAVGVAPRGEDDDGEAAMGRPKKGAAPKPACPECGVVGSVFKAKDREEWFCWKKKDGCGKTWTTDPAAQPKKGAPPSEVAAKEAATMTAHLRAMTLLADLNDSVKELAASAEYKKAAPDVQAAVQAEVARLRDALTPKPQQAAGRA